MHMHGGDKNEGSSAAGSSIASIFSSQWSSEDSGL